MSTPEDRPETETRTTMPQRIQRQHTKGWRMPEGARYVGRGSGYANIFVPGQMKFLADFSGSEEQRVVATPKDAAEATAFFRWYIEHSPERVETVRQELAGRDLACWCPIGQPCHADVLLDIANKAPVQGQDDGAEAREQASA